MNLALFPEHVGPLRGLDDGREALDAYWTPPTCAVACCEAIRAAGVAKVPALLEPAVGGGAWVDAARKVWPKVYVAACDIDPEAPGLRRADVAQVTDFTASSWVDAGRYSLVLGNPPYGDGIVRWFDRALDLAPNVAFLLRGTILGSAERMPWWEAHPPSDVWVLSPRPQWGGPGARSTTDTVDSLLVLWRQPPRAQHGRRDVVETRLRWLRWGR